MIDLGSLQISMLRVRVQVTRSHQRSDRRTFWKSFTSFERTLIPLKVGFEKHCFAPQVKYG